ncbi:hypothetical protein BU23DRAFT_558681 [Bimuria novae-zelandiae CBS 107.79]|uniref:Uncharacterized protein n=1 Tax=Bimuria novae-zelandiae CBS 107.79 TaxID=1447943 RepID=A0A6A5UWB0_9PLEO|nr:hypothetical protein BU23DRAFT_558681 [Bimuria novae-zelandiae CBS 107.79]
MPPQHTLKSSIEESQQIAPLLEQIIRLAEERSKVCNEAMKVLEKKHEESILEHPANICPDAQANAEKLDELDV